MSDAWKLSDRHLTLTQTLKFQQGQLSPEFQRQVTEYVTEAGTKHTTGGKADE
jgi:hypothetical protein